MKISFWLSLALFAVLGGLLFLLQQVRDARAMGLPPLYPIHFQSYLHEPCPSNITVGSLSVDLGSNCSKFFNDAAITRPHRPTLRARPL